MAKCRTCGADFTGNVCPYCGTKTQNVVEEKPTAEKKSSKNLLEEIESAKIELVDKCKKSVVKIYNYCTDSIMTGSGFIVSGGYIVTNAHVVKSIVPTDRIVIEYSSDLKLGDTLGKTDAKVVYLSVNDDIAILKPTNTIPSGAPKLDIEPIKAKQGETVFTIGNPLHYKFAYMEGSIANPEYNPEGNKSKYPYVQTTLSLNHGNSGGPVYNVLGNVVGMSTFAEKHFDNEANEYVDTQGYGFCVSSKAIVDAMKNIKK